MVVPVGAQKVAERIDEHNLENPRIHAVQQGDSIISICRGLPYGPDGAREEDYALPFPFPKGKLNEGQSRRLISLFLHKNPWIGDPHLLPVGKKLKVPHPVEIVGALITGEPDSGERSAMMTRSAEFYGRLSHALTEAFLEVEEDEKLDPASFVEGAREGLESFLSSDVRFKKVWSGQLNTRELAGLKIPQSKPLITRNR